MLSSYASPHVLRYLTHLSAKSRIVLATALVAMLASVSFAFAAIGDVADPVLQYSLTANRANSSDLQNKTLSGNVYIFANVPTNTKSVWFYMDPKVADLTKIRPSSRETYTPFDFAHTVASGNAIAFDTKRLQDGTHKISIVVTKNDGSKSTHHADFLVKNTVTTTTATTTTRPATTAAPTTLPPTNGAIWKPKPGTTWYWQINNKVNENVDVEMYDIDLFEAVPTARSYSVPGFGTVNVPKGDNAGVIERLHAKNKIVICYIDTGAAENNRPDIHLIPESVRGTVATDSDGNAWDEKWIDTRASAWPLFAPVMWARFDLAKAIGCDGIEADQNNHVGNETGFPESVAIDIAWYLEVAKQGHARGLSMGMKNGIEATNAQTVAAFDWALNEECHQYDECDVLQPFISAGKAVFNAEYPRQSGGASQAKACDNKGLSTKGYPIELGGGYFYDCATGGSLATGTTK